MSILATVAAFAVAIPVGSASASTMDTVRTGDGWLRGIVAAEHRSFQGIPYAEPPVRWRAPRPAKPWQGVRDATRPGSQCAQIGANDAGQPVVAGSEDCLYLNVTTPRKRTGPLPVLVFVHGGGLVTGFGSAYDPQRIVKQDAIVVTLNYRLGALGFLRHPALRDPSSGNFGLADQQAALRWVRHNIAAFGGDRRNVTLWGQSAGATSVCGQLAAPGARGLFDKAIVQSGPCGNAVLDLPTATSRGLGLAAEAGCNASADAERCLRDTPVERLVRQSDHDQTFRTLNRHAADKPWMPVAGTAVLPQQPLTALRQGTAASVPLIHGGTAQEMTIAVAMAYDFLGKPVTAAQYPGIVRHLFGEDADRILKVYPVAGYATPSMALGTLLSDYGGMQGACSQLPAIDAASRRAPVFAYEYAQPGKLPIGAHHSADLPYFLDREPPEFTPEEKAFAERLIGYWTTFARTGDPGPGWPAYRGGTATVRSLAIANPDPVNLDREHHCGFWSSVR